MDFETFVKARSKDSTERMIHSKSKFSQVNQSFHQKTLFGNMGLKLKQNTLLKTVMKELIYCLK